MGGGGGGRSKARSRFVHLWSAGVGGWGRGPGAMPGHRVGLPLVPFPIFRPHVTGAHTYSPRPEVSSSLAEGSEGAPRVLLKAGVGVGP